MNLHHRRTNNAHPPIAVGTGRAAAVLAFLSLTLAMLAGAGLTPAKSAWAQGEAAVAKIAAPINEQVISGVVAIQGRATSSAFGRYELAYASEPDAANWTVFSGAQNPVANGQLGTWNTTPLPPGSYALRLQVFSTDGTVETATVRKLTLNAAAAAQSAAGNAITSTAESGSPTATGAASADANSVSINLADIPRGFVRGLRLGALALGTVIGYAILKWAISFGWRKLRGNKPVDYGQ